MAILMGLNLLEVVQLRIPAVDLDVRQLGLPPLLQVRQSAHLPCCGLCLYLMGLVCWSLTSTPLAPLLAAAWVLFRTEAVDVTCPVVR